MERWVLTGAPGSGKTTLLRAVRTHGVVVVDEAATDLIRLAQSGGEDEPWARATFMDEIVLEQRRRERLASATGAPVALFDRSPLCTLALSRYAGHAPSAVLLAEIERVSDAATYQAAVLIVRAHGPLQRTAVRRITPQENERFERIHEEVYLEHGYRLIEVPAGTVAQRVRQVLRVITI
jgi:predicted ATPase